LEEVKNVLSEVQRLRDEVFVHRKVTFIHGKMKSEEKDTIMMDFKRGDYDILVATSVVEVGIDVPNASIMLIEGAERFGLSQLHQFRGRVGRGADQSYCFLFTSKDEQRYSRRLKAMQQHTDGFKLAEIDLQIRGPGELYGIKQSGIPDLKMASIMDGRTIALARKKAGEMLGKDPDLSGHPELEKMTEMKSDFLRV
jgi:ATP-dependent DNA helicase RecG